MNSVPVVGQQHPGGQQAWGNPPPIPWSEGLLLPQQTPPSTGQSPSGFNFTPIYAGCSRFRYPGRKGSMLLQDNGTYFPFTSRYAEGK